MTTRNKIIIALLLVGTLVLVFLIISIVRNGKIDRQETVTNNSISATPTPSENGSVTPVENIFDQFSRAKDTILNSFNSNFEKFNVVANFINDNYSSFRCGIDKNELKVLIDSEDVDIKSISKGDEISCIINKMGIDLIYDDSDGIYFAQPWDAFEAGIVFMKNDTVPESHSPSVTYTLVKDNWYYYVQLHA
jgi:hypothetical protein